ncbi:MAG: hypothetical protein PVG46_00015 [Desulfobacterales bacterium]|jgi:ubiquinone/menaquinone biosynthesis C-methylase UbiE
MKPTNPLHSIFDSAADTYDCWYDTPEGSAIFGEEIECLRLFSDDYSNRWLEVGVGTGRFAEALGITQAINLSPPMAVKAARRGIHLCVGQSEQPPFPKQMFDGALMALTLCSATLLRLHAGLIW